MSQRSSNCGGTFGRHHVVSAAADVVVGAITTWDTTGRNLLTRININ